MNNKYWTFKNMNNARRFRNHCVGFMRIVMADDGVRFLVVTPAQAERLGRTIVE